MRSLDKQIYRVSDRVSRTLDSFWFFLISLFSRNKPRTSIRDIPIKRKGHREPKPKAPLESHKTARWWKGPLEISLALATFLGLGLALLNFAPKISVDPSDSLASFSPLATTFVLSNEGPFDIHNVTVSAANLHMENSDP